jgi:arylsulfatase
MPSIAVIILDSLRKDTFDQYFDWLPGIRFENAWSPSHYTVPVHASLFTGSYPSEIGVHAKNETLDTSNPVLTEKLQGNGYTVRGFSENFLFSPVNDFDRGFDDFVPGGRAKLIRPGIFSWKKAISDSDANGFIRDLSIVTKCIRSDCRTVESLRYGWNLKHDSFDGVGELFDMVNSGSVDSDEFLIANLMQTHIPYTPPSSYRTADAEFKVPEEDSNSVLGGNGDYSGHRTLYENCAQYLSDKYRSLFKMLADKFDFVITLSDHGELFGEHQAIKHWYGVFPELTKVPLVLYKGNDEVRECTDLVSLLDVHKTIVNITGINMESRGCDLRCPDRSACLTEFNGIRSERIQNMHERGISEADISAHDRVLRGIALEPSYYAYETTKGFVETGTAGPEDPMNIMEREIDSLETMDIENSDNEISEEVRQHLEDLGYS